MKAVPLNRGRTFELVIERGENPCDVLVQVGAAYELGASRFTGFGGFAHVTLGYFDRMGHDFRKVRIESQVEVLSLIGDIAVRDGEHAVRINCVLGLRDGTTRGGRVLDASVLPTLEVIVTEWPEYVRWPFDARSGRQEAGARTRKP